MWDITKYIPFTYSDYPFGIFKLFFIQYQHQFTHIPYIFVFWLLCLLCILLIFKHLIFNFICIYI
jgi:hypothetical protein